MKSTSIDHAPDSKISQTIQEGNEREGGKKGNRIFMSITLKLRLKRRELRKQLTASENYLLDEIETATIGGENSVGQFCQATDIHLDELTQNLQTTKNKIYIHLKSLERRGLIVRQKSRFKGCEYLGLNPDVFGQILIDKLNANERRSFIKTIVDNSHYEEHPIPNRNSESTFLGSNKDQKDTELVPNRYQNEDQVSDFVDEISQESLRIDKNLKKENFLNFHDFNTKKTDQEIMRENLIKLKKQREELERNNWNEPKKA